MEEVFEEQKYTFPHLDLSLFNSTIAHYQCSICNECMQVLKLVGALEVYDEVGNLVGVEPILEMDGQPSFELVLLHELKHQK